MLELDSKVFISGHVSGEEDKASKLICDRIYPFDAGKRELWIQFSDQTECMAREQELLDLIHDSDGPDPVVLYAATEKAVKRLPAGRNVQAESELLTKLRKAFGQENVKVVEKRIENIGRMN